MATYKGKTNSGKKYFSGAMLQRLEQKYPTAVVSGDRDGIVFTLVESDEEPEVQAIRFVRVEQGQDVKHLKVPNKKKVK